MALSIYKKGQGYWTRVMTAIAVGLLIVMGANWQWGLLAGRDWPFPPVYAAMTGAVLVVAIFGWLTYLYVGLKPRSVDFLIATEGEMKKVNWSSRREIIGSTWVVIGLTILIGIFCWVCDLVFASIFQWAGVLDSV
jgi:preprotein translocase SecE subunit